MARPSTPRPAARRRPDARAAAQWPRRVAGLPICAVDDGFAIYQADRDRVHYLNHTGVLVLELCNGRNTAADIAALLAEAYGGVEVPVADIRDTLARLRNEGLVE
jgi:hypothetical protein